MATYEGYGSRYEKSKEKRGNNSRSASRLTPLPLHRAVEEHPEANQLGNVVAKLSDRIDGMQIKMASLTNIVKLQQKYTESKDEQYEKQKQNQEYRQNIVCGQQESPQLEIKIKEIELLSQKMKSEIMAMQSLRVGIARENCRRSSPEAIPHTLPSPQSARSIRTEFQAMAVELQNNLRAEFNKKVDICMNTFKTAIKHASTTKKIETSPTSINSVMLEEQIHNITINMNKLQNDCMRNRMIAEKKIEEVVRYVGKIADKSKSRDDRRRSLSRSCSITDRDECKSCKSSHSVKKKTTTPRPYNQDLKNRISQQKRIKEHELKQALKKKKQKQEKLKMKK